MFANNWFRKFSRGGKSDGRAEDLTPQGPIAVGIFGKHRRSPEHLCDLGGSAELTKLKDVLYDNGIRAAVDKGVWNALEGDAFVPFNHLLLAVRGKTVMLARVAATRDATRRTDFPMIVAVARTNARPSSVPTLFEVLRGAFHDAARAASLQDLHTIIESHRSRALTAPPIAADFVPRGPALGELSGRPALGPDDDGLLKVLYQMQRQMSGWMNDSTSRSGAARSATAKSPAPEASHIRLPPVAPWPVESVMLWARLFLEETSARAPSIMVFGDAAGNQVDLMVGDPHPPLLRCLHASAGAMPDVTRIPYELDAETVAAARERIARAVAACSAIVGPDTSTVIINPAVNSAVNPVLGPQGREDLKSA